MTSVALTAMTVHAARIHGSLGLMASSEHSSWHASSVAERLVEVLASSGVDTIFGLPGETGLGIVEAAHSHPDVEFVTTRHEEGATIMACAHSRLTHKPGVCLVSRGPGLAHAMIGLHTAQQDSIPLLMLVGQVERRYLGHEAFQEVDVARASLPWVKWAAEARTASEAEEMLATALAAAEAGRPGPTVVSVPSDLEREELLDCRAWNPIAHENRPPDERQVDQVARTLEASNRTVIIAGELVDRTRSRDALESLAEHLDAGVYTSWRSNDAYPNDSRRYLGTLPWLPGQLLEPLLNADVVVAVGTRLDQFTALHYRLPTASQTMVLVHPDPQIAERTHQVIRIAGHIGSTCRALQRSTQIVPRPSSTKWLADAHRSWNAATTPSEGPPEATIDDPVPLFHSLRKSLPSDAITTCDAGAFAGLVHRYLRWNRGSSFLGPMSGAMGYAIPAAIGARIAAPNRAAVAMAGDGGAMMTIAELSTAVHRGIGRLVCIVFDDSRYGAIEKHLSGPATRQVVGLQPVDFVGMAQAMGVEATKPLSNGEFEAAVDRGLAASTPTLVHVEMNSSAQAWPELREDKP